ncbi:E3 ubiquitin-protein ligase Siah2-like [Dermacentor andersoni]|uniref:E3 ubiquitin-protein ligase Siah2-like n=1 Tax=Dermacentor andersoni TaxID=34620 RepID=UPI0021553A92|nr:E3 ubiquitin-protein ligase Siah2-like [Dermacentor andersoni]
MSGNASRPRVMASIDLASELVSVFECPMCLDPIKPPIAQCMNGHLLCFPCRKKITNCPLCRERISSVRAWAMEKVAEKLPYLCKYSNHGCTAQPILRDKQDHEKTCDYRPCPCLFTAKDCKWTGASKDMMPHIHEAHRSLPIVRGKKAEFVVQDGQIPWSNERMTVQSCFGQHFATVLAMQHVGGFKLLHALVLILNTPLEARNFTYQLQMRKGDRTLKWTSRPTSVLEGVEAAMARGDGLVFDARNFAVKLTVEVTLKRCPPSAGKRE